MERTGYHVGNALELEALWPAENTGKRIGNEAGEGGMGQ